VDNVPHAVIITYTYELPFGRGKKFLSGISGALNHLVGGWNITGIHRYNSGRPLPIYMNNIYGGVLFNTSMRPDRVPEVSGYRDHDNSQFDIVNSRYLDRGAGLVPPEGRLGNSSRVDPVIRGWAAYSDDMSLFKSVTFHERVTMRLGGNFANILNRHQWCDPGTNISDTTNFGLVTGQCDVPRRIELYWRLQF
jgi:hypothetical protein